jgi:D-alanyl-D-alanine carboxypeptidase
LSWLHIEAEHPTFDERATLRRVVDEHSSLDAAPGARYQYSNLGYWLLGEVIRTASQMPFEEFVRAEILRPLRVSDHDISFQIQEPTRTARGHFQRWSGFGLFISLATQRRLRADSSGSWGRFERVYMNGPAYGGAFATARGYSKVLVDLLSPKSKLLSEASRLALFETQFDVKKNPLPTTLGLHRGSLDGHVYFSKPGGGPGFSANVRVYRELGIATVFLSNQMRVSESAIQSLSDELDRPFATARAHR